MGKYERMSVWRRWTFPFAIAVLVGVAELCGDTSLVLAQETRTWPSFKSVSIGVPSATPTQLHLVGEIGTEEGEGPSTLGFLADAALDQADRIYAIDPTEHRIAVFGPAGTFEKWIGRTGGGPGEMLSPFKLIIVGDTLIVYDRQLSRISFFSTAGEFGHSFQITVPTLASLAEGPDGTLFAAVPGRQHRLVQTDRSGKVIRTFVPTPEIDATTSGNYAPEPGAACFQPGGLLIYSNSWTYEIAGIDPKSGIPQWVRSDENEVMVPQKSKIPGVFGTIQRGAILGLECGPKRIVFAYFDRETSSIYYDFLDSDGKLTDRKRFTRDAGGPFPGFLGALHGDKLLTFRTKPFPQLFLYRVMP